MFKYFYNPLKEEESVYKLVEQQVDSNGKTIDERKRECKPSYRSKYSEMVREEADRNRAWTAKTMGVPRLPVEGPDMFLKKQSKRPLSVRPKSVADARSLVPRDKACQTIELKEGIVSEGDNLNSGEAVVKTEGGTAETSPPDQPEITTSRIRPKTCFQRICFNHTRKPPIPEPSAKVDVAVDEDKDFIKSNAVSVIGSHSNKPKDPKFYVDTVKGDTRQWSNSGLAPKYVHQKKFAHVPVYITLRKKEFLDELKKKQEEEGEKAKKSNVRILNQEERDKIIEGLHQNWQEVFSLYQRLPLLIDTPGKIKRKTSMEQELKKLEMDIQTLQRHDSIYVSDLAPRSFYAYNRDRKCK